MTAASMPPHEANATDFGRTRWSIVAGVRSGSEDEARESLSELCRRYWVPVYAYVRRCGHPPQSAATLVQAYLTHAVREIRARDAAPAGGFREFLQRRLEQFLASDWTRLEEAPPAPELAAPWPLEEIELRQQRDHQPWMTPAQAFQRAFAQELLEQALQHLRQEACSGDRGPMFDAVRPYLGREPGPGEYAQLAQRLHCSPLATVIAVKRLRQRFQELVDQQLAQTVGDRESFDTERGVLRSLWSEPMSE